MRFDEHFILQTLKDVSIEHGVFPREPHFVVDSRKVKKGDVFVALKGQHVDGHDFIKDALSRGARGVIVERDKKDNFDAIAERFKHVCVIVVGNTMQALIQLAKQWRQHFTIPIIGVTGSVGKTSTKEMIANILDVNDNEYLASFGNQNTVIGVSLNILRLKEDHEMAVFEVGIGKRGEMKQIVDILRPTSAVITTIGHSHMEGLGSLHDIALEKRAIFSYFNEKNIGIINGDLPILSNVSYPYPMIKFGGKTTNQIQARKVRISGSHISFVLKIYKDKYPIVFKQAHKGFVFNALAATAVAHLLRVPNEVIVRALQMPIVIVGRFQERPMINARGTIIDDCYNASPESMKAALLAFQQIETKSQKIAILGDMLELGVNSPFWHRQLGRFLRKVPSLDHVILVGSMIEWTHKTAPAGLSVSVVPSYKDAIDLLDQKLDHQDSVVLVKGSNGVGLSHVVKKFTPAQAK